MVLNAYMWIFAGSITFPLEIFAPAGNQGIGQGPVTSLPFDFRLVTKTESTLPTNCQP